MLCTTAEKIKSHTDTFIGNCVIMKMEEIIIVTLGNHLSVPVIDHRRNEDISELDMDPVGMKLVQYK